MNHHRAPLHCQLLKLLFENIINGKYIYADNAGKYSTYTNYFTGYDLENKKVLSFDLKTVKVSD